MGMALSDCVSKIDKTGLELVEHGTTGLPMACYHDDLVALGVDWHWHEELELVIVSEGTAIVAVDGERYVVEAGDGFFINSGVLHGCWTYNQSACKLHSIVFHARLIGGSENSVFWTEYLNPILNHVSFKGMFLSHEELWQKRALDSLESAWQIFVSEEAGFEFRVRNELSELLFLVWQHLGEKRVSSQKNNFVIAKGLKQYWHILQNTIRKPSV